MSMSSAGHQPRLGIDIGRVIIDGPSHPGGGDTAFFQGDLLPEHVRFCMTRPDKRIHCEQLGLTHFVDDHPEVHSAIRGFVDHHYFFGPQREPVPGYGIHVRNWAEAEALISASLGVG